MQQPHIYELLKLVKKKNELNRVRRLAMANLNSLRFKDSVDRRRYSDTKCDAQFDMKAMTKPMKELCKQLNAHIHWNDSWMITEIRFNGVMICGLGAKKQVDKVIDEYKFDYEVSKICSEDK